MVQWGAEYAIDGLFHDTDHYKYFFHSVDTSPNNWLQIDMGREETLCKVQLYSRADKGYSYNPESRENIEVRIGNIQASSDLTGNPLCATSKPHPTSYQTNLRCSTPLAGKLIVLRQSMNMLWSIDEVFAYSV